jgi:hypothetical protein
MTRSLVSLLHLRYVKLETQVSESCYSHHLWIYFMATFRTGLRSDMGANTMVGLNHYALSPLSNY